MADLTALLAAVTGETTAVTKVTTLSSKSKKLVEEALQAALDALDPAVSEPNQALPLAAIDDVFTSLTAQAQDLAFALWTNVPVAHPGAGSSVVGNLRDWG